MLDSKNSYQSQDINVTDKESLQDLNCSGSKPVYNQYEGKYFSVLGDSLSTYTLNSLSSCQPENLSPAMINSADDTWWGIVIKELGGKLLVNNSVPGRCVTDKSGSFDDTYYDFTKNLHIDNTKPDVIIVNLGMSDWINGTEIRNRNNEKNTYNIQDSSGTYKKIISRIKNIIVKSGIFDRTDGADIRSENKTENTDNMQYFSCAYEKIISEIKNNYPDAEVWCCCLANSNIPENTDKELFIKHNGSTIYVFNRIIIDTSEMLGCKCPDFCGGYGSLDGIYPTEDGMKKIADSILSYVEWTRKSCIFKIGGGYGWEEFYYDYTERSFYVENHYTGSVDDAADYISSIRNITDREMYDILKNKKQLNIYEKNKLLFNLDIN